VTDQHLRQIGMLGPGDRGERVEIVGDVHEIGDQRPLTVGSAVTDVIVGVDHGTAVVQCRRHMGVPAAVLGVAMDDLDDPRRRPVRVPPSVEDPAFGPLQKSLSHGHPPRRSVVRHATTGRSRRPGPEDSPGLADRAVASCDAFLYQTCRLAD